jgi:hypothetical protein
MIGFRGLKILAIASLFSLTSSLIAVAQPLPSLDETVRLAKEAVSLAGLPLPSTIERLQRLLNKDYGLNVRCDNRWFRTLSNARCLTGLRKISRAFYRDLIPPIQFPLSDSLEVILSETPSVMLTTTQDKTIAFVAYNSRTEDMAAYLTSALSSPATRSRAFVKAQFKKAMDQYDANVGLPLEFDAALAIDQRFLALNTILSVAKSNIQLFDRETEALYVSTAFTPSHERHLSLQEGIAFNATAEQLQDFLIKSKGSGVPVLANIQKLRAEVLHMQTQVAQRVKGDVQCSSYSHLRLEECLNALRRFDYFLVRHPDFKPYAKLIVVVSAEEVPQKVQSYLGDEATLAVRQDFDFVSLASYAFLKGWLP